MKGVGVYESAVRGLWLRAVVEDPYNLRCRSVGALGEVWKGGRY